MSVRVRFAPSPTGLLHVGALRTALYCHLFAKKHGGQNILRIEDTDRTRYNAESEQEFVTTLKWVGITFDEGPHVGGPHAPYRQSERKEAGIYEPLYQQLLADGKAYKAFDTPEELDEMREFQRINKMPTGYFGGNWRDASPDQVAAAEAAGKPSVVRLKIPRDQKIVFQDPIRGRTEWDSNVIDDPVIIKGDGMPTYHFAAMVDDHLMGITHVFRGEEWIPSLPKHLCLFEAFGWEPPVIVHCPVIVGNDGKKLSKRHGATRVLDYAAEGYLPYPLQNFIALIGWSPGDDKEALTPEELVNLFSIERIQPSPGRFDLEKLRWMNGLAIRELSPEDLLKTVTDYIDFPYTAEFFAQTEGYDKGDPFTHLETRNNILNNLYDEWFRSSFTSEISDKVRQFRDKVHPAFQNFLPRLKDFVRICTNSTSGNRWSIYYAGVEIESVLAKGFVADLEAHVRKYLANEPDKQDLEAIIYSLEEITYLVRQIVKIQTWTSLELLRKVIQDNPEFAQRGLQLEQDRVHALCELGPACKSILASEVEFDPQAFARAFESKTEFDAPKSPNPEFATLGVATSRKVPESHVKPMFESFIATLGTLNNPSPEECEAMVKDWAAENGMEKLGPVVMPVRVALTGRLQGPGLFDLMSVLGPQRTAQRFQAALDKLS